MFQLGMVVQQRIPMTNIYDTPEGIFGSPKKTSKSSKLRKPFKEVLGMMLQGPVLQGTTSFEYTFPGSLHCSFKINDTKENSTKHIKNNKPHFKLSAHTHRHITRQQICRGIVGASIFAIYSVFRSFRSGLWECFPGTKSARELKTPNPRGKKSNHPPRKATKSSIWEQQKHTKALFLAILRI